MVYPAVLYPLTSPLLIHVLRNYAKIFLIYYVVPCCAIMTHKQENNPVMDCYNISWCGSGVGISLNHWHCEISAPIQIHELLQLSIGVMNSYWQFVQEAYDAVSAWIIGQLCSFVVGVDTAKPSSRYWNFLCHTRFHSMSGFLTEKCWKFWNPPGKMDSRPICRCDFRMLECLTMFITRVTLCESWKKSNFV